ncbi:MAG TPA: zf-TFIIB domain-containing protein [Victivallales bacterium]|nr:zf-TFIIB domain-containing protein [Victivallales bacterium]
MLCPECDKEMLVIEFNDIQVDWCPDCGGTWLDEGELELICGPSNLNDPIINSFKNSKGTAGKRACPVCPEKMHVVQVQTEPPIDLDICPRKHGIWFDKGELEKMLSSVKEAPLAGMLSSIFVKR